MKDFKSYLFPQKYLRSIRRKLVLAKISLGWVTKVGIPVGDEVIVFQVSSRKEYLLRAKKSFTREAITMEWIEKVIQPGDIVWDIGANVGAYALLIGKKLARFGKGHVLAFEPESSNFAALNRNIQLNSLDHWITGVPIAFGGSKPDLGEFFLSSCETGSAMHGLHEPVSDGAAFLPSHRQGIISLPIDQFFQFSSVESPNHIKIDVDGLEWEIVQKMDAVLSSPGFKSILVELNEFSHGPVLEKCKTHGYELVKEERSGNSQVVKNCLLINGKYRDEFTF